MQAVIDIGSNSVLLLVGRRHADGSLEIVRDESTVARVSEGAAERGTLSPEAIERTLAVLRRYRARASADGVEQIQAVATEGLRMASNAAAFLDPAGELLGSPVRVISGDEEARLSYQSVAREHPDVAPLRVIDIGGASTELVVGRGLEVEEAVSHRLGSVRITEQLSDGHPPSPAALARMHAHAREVLAAQPLPAHDRLYGLAGTVTTVAGIHEGLRSYDRDAVDHTQLGIEELRQLRERLAALDLTELRKIPLLAAGRADVVVGGLTILLAALEHCGARTLVVRDRGLRYGLL
ncbi:Guanosine-5'-triphosphate,3'-diphosphate pyrophosphatase [Enhygromyxa salina]|uniref:Guanosine-5'-triphosphate,3'-diphosphate pyrophosphatase n=1 Tax=Enhygromyxa salina TaxID=215803 RepID=A0A2S9YCF9_9BACT|nr:Ppx/GppA phosphatase family protein [Enhygromyxa salina]PRQ02789.1 Guanosine-5'-triphosphate,3'-diphosphate pyrophosphatase [Enhygromyxa salina]